MSALQSPEREFFSERHNGPQPQEISEMLETVGAETLEELIEQTVPLGIHRYTLADFDEPVGEAEFLRTMRGLASKNKVFRNYIGLGYNNTIIPKVVLRNILENPGWYTQYTPYQAEISQGRLEALLNFQTLISDLTGLPVANASLLDEATAAAEAMSLMYAGRTKEAKKEKRNVLFVDTNMFPQTADVLRTRAEAIDIELKFGEVDNVDWTGVFGAIVQNPAGDGSIRDLTSFCDSAHQHGALVTVVTDIMSMVIMKSPAEMGADVAVGYTQRFGVPMGFGGPAAAFFATREDFKRNMPGRIIGMSVDRTGQPALRMALQTREQHIRRDKATSNICTAQVLLAIMTSMYAVYHGPRRLKAIATTIHRRASLLADTLEREGIELTHQEFFDTVGFKVKDAELVQEKALEHRMNFRYIDDETVSISVDETTLQEHIDEMLVVLEEAGELEDYDCVEETTWHIPQHLQRTSEILTHPVFSMHHSETEMLRYMKRLENKDLSLTLSMIPLGSCTMKLNATTELLPITWPEFSEIHPFAPADQRAGYDELFERLEHALCVITGFDAISLQPNSGAQGEFAGLMAIRNYHIANGNGHRDVALIPSSAHGTNPASAIMAGMKVVVVKCDNDGNIDIEDLRAKAEKHSENLAALMVTYPSTHGVFEETIRDICISVQRHGGRVYMDGANMNAQVGVTSPRTIGADVCHLNLHKTFAIPHGGGGPGVGPIGVTAELAPYLPGHSVVDNGRNGNAVTAAPWGSAGVLPISYAYITMMGKVGLWEATSIAILNANYLKKKLEGAYDVLYVGKNGRVAHEMILDTRPFKTSAGIEVEDIAKRLMDYGFHAPTVSFPVPGTLMVEPTESENKVELDRFITAMLSIREEIREIEEGTYPREDNVLKNAPHTVHEITGDVWEHSYSRSKAAWPVTGLRDHKFWPSVARVNNTQGDRNLICTCPPIEAYVEDVEG